ncbi:MAG: hypothetical protein RIQ52_1336 [Pseudomonadota bacterium]|jgi:methylthioribulose-1-phosphate dehydratase
MSNDFELRAAELIAAGKRADERGWVPATSGNFSARLQDQSIAITVSGRHKGRLQMQDIMQIDAAGVSMDHRKPSAETLLHTQLYASSGSTGAVLHPHSPAATLISMRHPEGVTLQDLELLKALEGIHTHEAVIHIPVFANDQNIERLASKVAAHMDQRPMPMHAYLIAGHGLYTWASTVEIALRQVEALEAMFELTLRLEGKTP